MTLNKKILIQKLNIDENEYEEYYNCHAEVNRTGGGEYLLAGAVSTKNKFTFQVRYCKELKDIQYNTQKYRIIYDDVLFNVVDADDFKQKHKFIKIIGESING